MGAESIWIKIKLGNNEMIKFGCIYRSPNSTGDVNSALTNNMRMLENSPSKEDVIIVGDFNYPEVNEETSPFPPLGALRVRRLSTKL